MLRKTFFIRFLSQVLPQERTGGGLKSGYFAVLVRLNGGGTLESNQESRLFLVTDPNVAELDKMW